MAQRSRAKAASGLLINSRNGIGTVSWAGWPLTARTPAQIGLKGCARRWDRCAAGLVLLQGPLLNSAVDLPQVIDAGISLRRGAGVDEVRNRDGSQKANNCHHDHDLHQREARLSGCGFFHTYFSFRGVNNSIRRVYY